MKLSKIALLIITLFTMSTYGQTEKGNFFIGFDSNSLFSTSSNKLTRSDSDAELELGNNSTFSLSSRVGYFISDGFFLGVKGNLNYFRFKDDDNISTNTIFSIGPNLRYYFLSNNYRPFLNASYTFQTNKAKSKSTQGTVFENQNNQGNLELGGGIAFILNPNIALELSLNYGRITSDQSNDFQDFKITKISNQFLASIGFSIFL